MSEFMEAGHDGGRDAEAEADDALSDVESEADDDGRDEHDLNDPSSAGSAWNPNKSDTAFVEAADGDQQRSG